MIQIAMLVRSFFTLLTYLLLARAIMSWVVRDWYHPFPQFILRVTEPILAPMRQLFDQLNVPRMGIDFSFLATFLLINFLGNALFRFLVGLA